ncbi:MAG: hypothetical protein Q7K21_02040, partial [Elusimicrobiota bacterium]|nr:hypothetical protein [Elusimicrobiota bacterium]
MKATQGWGVTLRKAANNTAFNPGTRTVYVREVGAPTINSGPTPTYPTKTTSQTGIVVNALSWTKLRVLVPSQSRDPGNTSTNGRAGGIETRTAGNSFTIIADAVDDYWNLVDTGTPVNVAFDDADDPYATDGEGLYQITAGSVVVSGLKFRVAGNNKNIIISTYTKTDTSSNMDVNYNSALKLLVLAPGETAVPGSTLGKTGAVVAQTAGTPFDVTVNAVDLYWNKNLAATNITTMTTTDVYDTEPSTRSLTNGSTTFSLTLVTGGTQYISAVDSVVPVPPGLISNTTYVYIKPNLATRLQLLVPGETLVPGKPGSGGNGQAPFDGGKQMVRMDLDAGVTYYCTVYLVDNWYNMQTATAMPQVWLKTVNDSFDTENTYSLIASTRMYPLNFTSAGNQSISMQIMNGLGYDATASSTVIVIPGVVDRLRVILPGETATTDQAETDGKAGSPDVDGNNGNGIQSFMAGVAFTVTINSCDVRWNTSASGQQVKISVDSTDQPYSTPVQTPNLDGNGVATVSITLKKATATTFYVEDNDGVVDMSSQTVRNVSVVPNPTLNQLKLQVLVPGETAVAGK